MSENIVLETTTLKKSTNSSSKKHRAKKKGNNKTTTPIVPHCNGAIVNGVDTDPLSNNENVMVVVVEETNPSEANEICKITKVDSNDNIAMMKLEDDNCDNLDDEGGGVARGNTSDNISSSDLCTALENLDLKQNKLYKTNYTRRSDVEKCFRTVDTTKILYIQYKSEIQMPMVMKIIQKDLSEPYSIYTYRYFIHNWPKLCYLAMYGSECVGAIVCKLDLHRKVIKRGYIAMLAVDQNYRKMGIGSSLVCRAIREMIAGDADEVVLETEVTNRPALHLYEALGFVRDKRLFRYYLNGVDALRLKLWLR